MVSLCVSLTASEAERFAFTHFLAICTSSWKSVWLGLLPILTLAVLIFLIVELYEVFPSGFPFQFQLIVSMIGCRFRVS